MIRLRSDLALEQLSAGSDGQAEQVDETGAVLLVVDVVLVEGGDLFAVEGEGRGDAGVDDVALVQLQANSTGDVLLGLGLPCLRAVSLRDVAH